MESSLWHRIGPVLSPVPGPDAGAEARGDGDIVVVAVKAVGAVCHPDREPGGGLGEGGSGVFRDGERIEERDEIVGGVEDSPLGISTILPIPLDTKEDIDGSPFVDIPERPSHPLGTSRISSVLLLPSSES